VYVTLFQSKVELLTGLYIFVHCTELVELLTGLHIFVHCTELVELLTGLYIFVHCTELKSQFFCYLLQLQRKLSRDVSYMEKT